MQGTRGRLLCQNINCLPLLHIEIDPEGWGETHSILDIFCGGRERWLLIHILVDILFLLLVLLIKSGKIDISTIINASGKFVPHIKFLLDFYFLRNKGGGSFATLT